MKTDDSVLMVTPFVQRNKVAEEQAPIAESSWNTVSWTQSNKLVKSISGSTSVVSHNYFASCIVRIVSVFSIGSFVWKTWMGVS